MRELSTAIAETTSHLIHHANLLYPALLSPHSHSIIPRHRNALIFRRKFLQLVAKSRHVIRQKFPLLILKGNFRNSETDRFQPLSASIGRFFEISSENGPGQGGEKTVRLGRNNLDL
jgi:hypothetical protein